MIGMIDFYQPNCDNRIKWLEREIGAEIYNFNNCEAIKDYHEHDFNQLLEVLKRNRKLLSIEPSYRKTQELLEKQFIKSMSILSPLKARIKTTDEFIDIFSLQR